MNLFQARYKAYLLLNKISTKLQNVFESCIGSCLFPAKTRNMDYACDLG